MKRHIKLVSFVVLLLLLGLSLATGPVKSNYTGKPVTNQNGNYSITLINIVYYDYDGDGYNDTFTAYFNITGDPNKDVSLNIYVGYDWDNSSMSYYYYELTLNDNGQAITDFTYTGNYTTTYHIDVELYDINYNYLNYFSFDVYLDGYGMQWAPQPNLTVNVFETYSDTDADGYEDTITFHFNITELNNPLYITDYSVYYSYSRSIGAYYDYVPLTYYGDFVNQYGHSQFNITMSFNKTGYYDLDFVLYDQLGRRVYDYYSYSKMDGVNDVYRDYTINPYWFYTECVSTNNQYINAIKLPYEIYMYSDMIDPNENYTESVELTLSFEVWLLGDYYFSQTGSLVLGNNSVKITETKFNITLDSQNNNYFNSTELFELQTAGDYAVIFSVYEPDDGFLWLNNTMTCFAPVGVPLDGEPITLMDSYYTTVDTDNDSLVDTIIVQQTIELSLFAQYTVYVSFDVWNNENGNYYAEDRSFDVFQPTNLSYSFNFTAYDSGTYNVSLNVWLSLGGFWQELFHQSVYLYAANSVTSTTTSTSSNNTSSTTSSTSSTTSSTSDSTSTNDTSSETTTETSPTTSETSESNSTTPELPLPVSFTTIVTSLVSTATLIAIIRKRR